MKTKKVLESSIKNVSIDPLVIELMEHNACFWTEIAENKDHPAVYMFDKDNLKNLIKDIRVLDKEPENNSEDIKKILKIFEKDLKSNKLFILYTIS